MVAYLAPLTGAQHVVLAPASKLSQEEQALDPLHYVLADIPCAEEPVVLVGNLNARVASQCPDLPDHPPHCSVDQVVNSWGPAFLWLCEETGLRLLHGTSKGCCGATSFHSLSYGEA